MSPKVSVVLLSYNHARFLSKRIGPILNQTSQDVGLICLDDCSTDDGRATLDTLKSDSRVRLYFNERNSGSPFIQWNAGVNKAFTFILEGLK